MYMENKFHTQSFLCSLSAVACWTDAPTGKKTSQQDAAAPRQARTMTLANSSVLLRAQLVRRASRPSTQQ